MFKDCIKCNNRKEEQNKQIYKSSIKGTYIYIHAYNSTGKDRKNGGMTETIFMRVRLWYKGLDENNDLEPTDSIENI